MGDSNKKQLTVDDVPDVFKTFRGENGSKITKKIHSPTAQAFSKSILPNQLRDKSHDLWLHPSVKFLSDSVGDASVLLTTQNSGSNEGHVEGYSIDTTESSDVIQEIQFPTEKLRDSTDQANLLRVVNTQETEAEATCGTTQVAFGNFALPNAPPKWFLEYMEAFKRELLEKSLSRLDKIEEKLENVVAIMAANPLLAANTEKNAVEGTNVSAENRNRIRCDSYVNTDRLIELEKAPTSLNIFPHTSSEIPLHSVNRYVTASPQENLNETVVASEILQDAMVPETSDIEHQGMAETPITMDASQDQTDKILLAAEPEYLNKATMTIDNPAGGSKETTDDRGEHSHTSIVCPHGCETTDLTEEDIETHIKESCPALTVNCSFKKVDCGFKGTQHIVEKHQKESTSHHLGLMCSFAERQQQELVKLQSQIEVQTKDKKDSGMFIRVAERIPLLNYACYVDGLREDQRVRLSNILKLKFNNFFGISNINYPGYQQQFVCVHEVHGIRALDFMSFLKKEYSAKIISYDNMYSYESPNSGPGYPSGIILPNGLAFWILEVDEI
ncbi:uncharacterized protein LOC136031645 isoform X1 [Artemia franciscana]|uniref:uncharacterized protein LOC136031645 isoform X1 n=1 Tax=Artemia franciscana TaxID=6661 RepID=UPI0032DBDD11